MSQSTQQLMAILSNYPIHPTVLPIPLVDVNEPEEGEEEEESGAEGGEEEELVEDLETEDLMRTYGSKKAPGSKYRWRRSRFLRTCPVALADGDVVPGKTQYTVGYASCRLLTSFNGAPLWI